jgi:hypothetical protein
MFRPLLYKAFSAIGAREVAAMEAASRQTRLAQQTHLLAVLKENADSEFGKKHSFAAIRSIKDFQSSVAVQTYEALEPFILRQAAGEKNILTTEAPFMFATTSGTSGARKLIPITRAYVKEFRKASVVSGFHLLRNFPRLARGVSLTVFSPAEESQTSAGIPCGAISGRLYLEEPPLIKKYISPIPYEVFVIADYESRYYSLLRCALVLPVTSIYTLNPSTIVILAKRLKTYAATLVKDIHDGKLSPPQQLPAHIQKALRPFTRPNPEIARRLSKLLECDQFIPPHVWPDLSLISCWTKAAASFYLQDFPQYFDKTPVCDITYGASEGRGTVCLSPLEQMLAIRSHFFEFIDEGEVDKANPTVRTADELETGRYYYILFTTSAGLYRYNINDIVKVVGWHNNAPLLEFLHKGGNISSFTGEKITESQVTEAVKKAAEGLKVRIRFFTVLPKFRPEPHYHLFVELDCGKSEAWYTQTVAPNVEAAIAANVDRCLGILNIEYQAKRDSKRLADFEVTLLNAGTYEHVRKSLVAKGTPDAQIKISHLNAKQETMDLIFNASKQLGTETQLSLPV